jgi:hypothetical protein
MRYLAKAASGAEKFWRDSGFAHLAREYPNIVRSMTNVLL